MMSRPVLDTDSHTSGSSQGNSVRRSITSTEMPSSAAASAACTQHVHVIGGTAMATAMTAAAEEVEIIQTNKKQMSIEDVQPAISEIR